MFQRPGELVHNASRFSTVGPRLPRIKVLRLIAGHGGVPCAWEDLFWARHAWDRNYFSTSFHGSRVANCMLHASGIQWLLKLGFGLTCTPSWSFWSHWGNIGRAQNLNVILETWSGHARVCLSADSNQFAVVVFCSGWKGLVVLWIRQCFQSKAAGQGDDGIMFILICLPKNIANVWILKH